MFTQCMVWIEGYLRAQNSHEHMHIGAVQIEMKFIYIYIYTHTMVQFQLALSALTLRRVPQVLHVSQTNVVQSIQTTCTIFYILDIRKDLYKKDFFSSNLWNFGTRSLMESTADLIRSNLSSQGTGDCSATLLNPNLFWCT